MLNVNWEKIHSIILSVTCDGLRNFAPAHTHPLKTICEFSKPYELLFFELESLVKCNHKIRVQECYGGRAMSCPWHGGWRHWGPLSVDMQPYGCFISNVEMTKIYVRLFECFLTDNWLDVQIRSRSRLDLQSSDVWQTYLLHYMYLQLIDSKLKWLCHSYVTEFDYLGKNNRNWHYKNDNRLNSQRVASCLPWSKNWKCLTLTPPLRKTSAVITVSISSAPSARINKADGILLVLWQRLTEWKTLLLITVKNARTVMEARTHRHPYGILLSFLDSHLFFSFLPRCLTVELRLNLRSNFYLSNWHIVLNNVTCVNLRYKSILKWQSHVIIFKSHE